MPRKRSGAEVGGDSGAAGNDDADEVHLVLEQEAEVVEGTGGSGLAVQVDDPADELLGLHGAFFDLAHAVGHGVVLLQHAVVEFADGEDARHEVGEVVDETVGEGGEPFAPDGIGEAVLGDGLAGDVQKHPVVAQKLAVGGDGGGADVHEVDELTGGRELDAVDEAEGFRLGAVFGQLLVEVFAVPLENEVEKEAAVTLEALVIMGEELADALAEVAEGEVRTLGEENAGKVAEVVRQPPFRLLQTQEHGGEGAGVVGEVSHEGLLQLVVRGEGGGEAHAGHAFVRHAVETGPGRGGAAVLPSGQETGEFPFVKVPREAVAPRWLAAEEKLAKVPPDGLLAAQAQPIRKRILMTQNLPIGIEGDLAVLKRWRFHFGTEEGYTFTRPDRQGKAALGKMRRSEGFQPSLKRARTPKTPRGS